MTEREALKLALEALETNNKAWKHLADSGDAGFWEAEEQPFYELSVKAITAIKEALAQPEQEPFCYVYIENGEEFFAPKNAYVPDDAKPLYTTPPQRKPLTDEEIIQVASTPAGAQATTKGYVIPFARAIEAAHGIKGEA